MKAKCIRCYSYFATTLVALYVSIGREDFRRLLAKSKHIANDDYGRIYIYDENWRTLGYISCSKRNTPRED